MSNRSLITQQEQPQNTMVLSQTQFQSIPVNPEPRVSSGERLLFEDASVPVRFWLEELAPNQLLRRIDDAAWEEFFTFEGSLSLRGRTYKDCYLCVPPGESIQGVRASKERVVLLRALYQAGSYQQDSVDLSFHCSHGRQFTWEEIPSRRVQDPGGRTAELFRSKDGTQITTLMECRPGWILPEHDHPTDVFTFCLRGGGKLGIEKEVVSLTARQFVSIPAGTRHWFTAGDQGALFIIFVFTFPSKGNV